MNSMHQAQSADLDATVQELQSRYRSLVRFTFRTGEKREQLRECLCESLVRARAGGLTNRDIAEVLGVSTQRVTLMLREAESIVARRRRMDAA